MSAHDEPGNEAQRQLLHAEDTSGTDNNLGDDEEREDDPIKDDEEEIDDVEGDDEEEGEETDEGIPSAMGRGRGAAGAASGGSRVQATATAG